MSEQTSSSTLLGWQDRQKGKALCAPSPVSASPNRGGKGGGCRGLLAAVVLLMLAGCPLRPATEPKAPIEVLAVLEIEEVVRAETRSVPGESAPARRLETGAGQAVTAQIYAVLAERSDFRFVPDMSITDAMRNPDVRAAAKLVERARALGKVVEAEGVISGTVSRFEERVGTEFGATRPASVSFELFLVEVASGEVRWRRQFDETQEALSDNLLNFWMFWRGGPRWFTARNLTRLGVERLFDDLRKAARP